MQVGGWEYGSESWSCLSLACGFGRGSVGGGECLGVRVWAKLGHLVSTNREGIHPVELDDAVGSPYLDALPADNGHLLGLGQELARFEREDLYILSVLLEELTNPVTAAKGARQGQSFTWNVPFHIIRKHPDQPLN